MAWIRGNLLGAGAFGSVNLAIHREDGSVFACKSVAVNANSELAMRAIENEISVLSGLESQFVVRCLGSDWTSENGQTMRNAFLEYMPEGCLTDFVKQFARAGALDEHLLRTYTRSLVEGIQYLHSHNIVHCDIKGTNILVGNGSVKLTDFGSAKRVVGDPNLGANVGANVKVNGTPLWMAPEVVRQVEQGFPSDIWSLGCTVVEMATGRAPWSNLTGMNQFVALYHIGCTDELPEIPTWLSPDAHDFLSHCFERDPRRRWTSTQLLRHPFLTTRFIEPAPATSCFQNAPTSPTSVMQFGMRFPGEDDDCDSDDFSVPTLVASSPLQTRKLADAQVLHEQVECAANWWSSSPDSGPWIVVRSPKSAAASECGDSETVVCHQQSSTVAPVSNAASHFVGSERSLAAGRISCTESEEAVVDHSPLTVAIDESTCSETDFRLRDCRLVKFTLCENEAESSPTGFSSLGLNFPLHEYSVLVKNQYDSHDAQILRYWCHESRLPSDSLQGRKVFWKFYGSSDRCILQSLREYTFSLLLEIQPDHISSLAIVYVSVCGSKLCRYSSLQLPHVNLIDFSGSKSLAVIVVGIGWNLSCGVQLYIKCVCQCLKRHLRHNRGRSRSLFAWRKKTRKHALQSRAW